jgi:hypothetical protein
MDNRDRFKLLRSPYEAPPLRRGHRATCLYRDCDVVVTSWTNARISWPRCRAVGSRGGSGLLVDTELLRAIRTESAAAIKHWWGVGTKAVWNWRKAIGITQRGTEGSVRLHRKLSETGASRMRGKRLPKAFVKRRGAARRAKGYVVPDRWAVDGWKWQQVALLGRMSDEIVAKKTSRSVNAVRLKRTRLGIPTTKNRRRKRGQKG